MPITAASKVAKKYRDSLEKGVEPPPPRTDVNRVILEEIRKEVTLAKKDVRAVAHAGQETVRRQTKRGKAEIEEATAHGKRVLEEAFQDTTKRLKLLQLDAQPLDAQPLAERGESGASSGDVVTAPLSESEDEPELPPTDPEELGYWEEERALKREWELARPAEEEARRVLYIDQQAKRAAAKLATMSGLPAPPAEMPNWFQTNVQRYYRRSTFLQVVEAAQRHLHEDAEERMMPMRKKCRKCRDSGHRSRGLNRHEGCSDHQKPEPDASAMALIEERLRDEYAGEAALAAMEMRKADVQREMQLRVDEETARVEGVLREKTAKEVIERIAPGCRDCADCHGAGFGPQAKFIKHMSAQDCLVMMCPKHLRAFLEAQASVLEVSAASQSLAMSTC